MQVAEAPPAPSTPVVRSGGRRLLTGFVLGVVASVLLAAVVVGPIVLAKRNDLPLERVYGDFAVGIASKVLGGNQQNPLANDRRALAAGREAYTGSCGVCHGANGDGRGVFGPSSYPNATDLRSHDAAEKSDAQLFWIIKNGLSFTGMPGFGEQYTDQDTWSLVSYIRALQNASDSGTQPAQPSPPSGPPQSQSPFTFQLAAVDVPKPTPEQLQRADPASTDAPPRGAAVYFAQGCQTCHGAAGDAPGDLGLPRGSSPEAVRAVREGRQGMPHYDQRQISDAELTDLQAYLATIGSSNRGGGGDRGRGPGGPPRQP